jgi:type IV pilus assembly protein PilE
MAARGAPGFNTMHPSKWGAIMHTNPGRSRGFTLIELMIVVVIAGILAAIALPSYWQYIQRSKIVEATTGLSNWRTRMEQYFLDNRTYVNGCALYHDPIQAQVKSFTLTCSNEAVNTYTLTADGTAAGGTTGFSYTVDQSNVKSTAGLPSGWTTPSPNDCWATRKDGTCG